jgi:hypothetical protein
MPCSGSIWTFALRLVELAVPSTSPIWRTFFVYAAVGFVRALLHSGPKPCGPHQFKLFNTDWTCCCRR